MPIAWVGDWVSAQFGNNTGGSLGGRTSTGGNFVAIGYGGNDGAATFSQSQAGTIQTARGFDVLSGGGFDSTRYIENIPGGASHTITVTTAAGSFSCLNATEYSGVAIAGSLDQTAVGTGSSTTLLSGSVTPLASDELQIGVGSMVGAAGAYTAGTNFTLRGHIDNASIGASGYLEDRVVANSGTYQAGAGKSGDTGNWTAQISTFRAATGSPAFQPFLGRVGDPSWQWQQQYGTDPVVVAAAAQAWAQTISTPDTTVSLLTTTVYPGFFPGLVETVPVPRLIQAFALPQPPPFGLIVPGRDPSAIETVPQAFLVAARAVPQSVQPAQVFVALTPGNAPVTSFYVPLIQASAIPQPLQAVALASVLNPSTVETVPVPTLIVARALPQPLQAASVQPGLFPGLVETVPVFVTVSGQAVTPVRQDVRVIQGLTPGAAPTVFTFVPTLAASAIAIRLPDGRIYLGLTPGNPPASVPDITYPTGFVVLSSYILTFAGNPTDTHLVATESGLFVVLSPEADTIQLDDSNRPFGLQ